MGAGFNWRCAPIERHELVFVTQIRSADVGRDTVIKSTGLRESAMLTEDENIVEIKFAVQYRLSDARAWLFESKNPSDAVVQAAETAVREVVGKMRMDTALAEERDQIAPGSHADANDSGPLQSGRRGRRYQLAAGGASSRAGSGVFRRCPESGPRRERAKNEAQAYANDVVPRAVGSTSRLNEEAAAYKARIVAQAQGDAQRFLVGAGRGVPEGAPGHARSHVPGHHATDLWQCDQVLVESRQGSNLLYLPLDKIMQSVASGGVRAVDAPATSAAPAVAPAAPAANFSNDPRARDSNRTRDRESR